MSSIIRMLLAVVLAAVCYLYFSLVLPHMISAILAALLVVAELVITGSNVGRSALRGLLPLLLSAAPLLCWPAIFLAIRPYIPAAVGRPGVLTISAALSSICALLSRGPACEPMRLFALNAALLMVGYSLLLALPAGLLPVAAGSLSLSATLTVARYAIVLPRRQASALGLAAGIALVTAVGLAAGAFV